MQLPKVGDTFAGRFRIEHELGRGGFATVYGALDAATMGSVALKVLKPGPQGYVPDDRARFQRLPQARH